MGLLNLSPNRQELLFRIGILSLIYVIAFFVRLFSVLRYESVIHEVRGERRSSLSFPFLVEVIFLPLMYYV